MPDKQLDQAKSLLQRLRGQSDGKKILFWIVQENPLDAQGLSDRRACLAIILAEALLLDRAVILPYFSLSAHHNGGREVVSDLLKYISLENIPHVQTLSSTLLRKLPRHEIVHVMGSLDPKDWRFCKSQVILRRASRQGFWKTEIHNSVMKLAGEIHGTGMQCTSGLFGPSFLVASIAEMAIQHLKRYVGVHLRRGDKLAMMPGLKEATSPESVVSFLLNTTTSLQNVYLATDDKNTSPYCEALRDAGFNCYTKEMLKSWLTSEQWEDLIQDNFLCFAIEMKIVDDATMSVRSFNDAMPWFTLTGREVTDVKKSYHLLDRSMHDYILGSSALGTSCALEPCNPLDLDRIDSIALYDALVFGKALPRRPRNAQPPIPHSILTLEISATSARPFAAWWPMRSAPEALEGDLEVLVEVLPGPKGPAPTGVATWTSYFGPLASFDDELPGGLIRRSTLYGFENLSVAHHFHRDAEISRSTGAVFIYVSMGMVTLTDHYGKIEMCAGQYGVTQSPVKLQLAERNTRVVAIHSEPFTALRSFGGPIETKGRLRYVDGCSDTLLLAPPKLSDPCLNLLHFPPNICQTPHTHPSIRCGLIASGGGYCMDAQGLKIELQPGMVWSIPKNTVHSFHTDQSELNVIAYHPDTDWGPMDENHPMLNRTWVAGDKIDNTSAEHLDADMLQTEQSFIQTWHSQHDEQLPGVGNPCLMIFEHGHPLKAMQLQPIGDDHFVSVTKQSMTQKETVEVQPGKYLVKYAKSDAVFEIRQLTDATWGLKKKWSLGDFSEIGKGDLFVACWT